MNKDDRDTLIDEILTDVLNNYCSVHDAKVKIEQKIRTATLDELEAEVYKLNTYFGDEYLIKGEEVHKAIDNLRGGGDET